MELYKEYKDCRQCKHYHELPMPCHDCLDRKTNDFEFVSKVEQKQLKIKYQSVIKPILY